MVRTRTRDLTTGLEDRLLCDGDLSVAPLSPSQQPSDQNQFAAMTQQEARVEEVDGEGSERNHAAIQNVCGKIGRLVSSDVGPGARGASGTRRQGKKDATH